MTPEGLIGVVREVDRAHQHRDDVGASGIPGERRVGQTGDMAGIVGPTAIGDASRTSLEFRAITYRDTLPDGAVVVASGLGGVYPRGVPVGTRRWASSASSWAGSGSIGCVRWRSRVSWATC